MKLNLLILVVMLYASIMLYTSAQSTHGTSIDMRPVELVIKLITSEDSEFITIKGLVMGNTYDQVLKKVKQELKERGLRKKGSEVVLFVNGKTIPSTITINEFGFISSETEPIFCLIKKNIWHELYAKIFNLREALVDIDDKLDSLSDPDVSAPNMNDIENIVSYLQELHKRYIEKHHEKILLEQKLSEMIAEKVPSPDIGQQVALDAGLTSENIQFLVTSVMKQTNRLTDRFTLIYQASRDGFESTEFHKLCDNIPSLLTIVLTKAGNIFGGFSVKPFIPTMYGQTVNYDSQSFIYTLVNQYGISPTILLSNGGGPTSRSNLGPSYGSLKEKGYFNSFSIDEKGTGGDSYLLRADEQEYIFTGFKDTTGKGKALFFDQYLFRIGPIREILCFQLQN